MVHLPAENPSYGEENPIEEAATNKPWQNFVMCLYKANVGDTSRYVTATWSKNLASHSLCIAVENFNDEEPYICKIDLKTWQFWGKKGLKSFKIDDHRVDVFWDFRSAKFSNSPEPCSDYYVALVSNSEVFLVLGDQNTDALKRAKCRPSSVEASLLHKKENVFGKKSFCARTMLGKGKKEHQIFIETSLSGGFDPEMWIGIDGVELLRVNNLHWRFRGNENIMVDDVPIHIFWDVHDWLYNGPDAGPGMFIFMRGLFDKEHKSQRNGADIEFRCDSSTWDLPLSMDLCHFLYAWMDE